jgi:hypothetical protein
MNVLSVSDATVLKSIFIIRLYKSNSCANIGIMTVQGSYFLMVYTPDQKQKENTWKSTLFLSLFKLWLIGDTFTKHYSILSLSPD